MKRTLILLLLTGSLAHAQEPERLGIQDAVRLGREQNRSLKMAAARMDAAGAKAEETRASLYPVLRFQGGYRRLSEVDPFVVKLPMAPAPIEISPVVLNNTTLGVSLQQPLFTGFRLRNASRAAALQAEAAAEDRQAEEDDLVLNITSAYWGYYQTLQNHRYLEENVARLEADESDTGRLMEAGLLTRSDLLRVQLQLSTARLALIDAKNEAELAMMTLNNVLGRPLGTETVPVSIPAGLRSDSAAPGSPDLDEEALIRQAFAARADVQALSLRRESAAAAVAAARGAWWPQIFLTGGYSYNRPNLRYQPTRDEFKSSWDVGVQIQFDLWNWGATGAQVSQSEAAARQTDLQFEQMRENVALDVRRSLLNVRRSREKIKVAQLGISQAEEHVRTTNDRFRTGLATSTDLLNAEVALLQAQTSLTGALVEQELALARLAKATGRRP